MRIKKSILIPPVSALLAVSAAIPKCGAVTETEATPPARSQRKSPAKKIHVPTKQPINAPCVSWLPTDGKPRLAMLCIHGFSLHKGCFAEFGKEMANDGIATYAIDLRGFGELKEKTPHTELDFDGCLVDIKATLERIHKDYPGLPVVILGESMGGAIALRATALYPELVSALVSSVPARDRTGVSEGEAKVGIKAGLNTIFGGFSKPINNAAMGAVDKISDKEDLRSQWKNDPLMRTAFSPKEFVQFDRFMAENLDAAAIVKDTPVLFICGTNDKLIRPAGTWKLYERLSTPNRQIVLSKNSEHLIFEEGQFRSDDLSFLTTWISRNVTPLDAKVVGATAALPVVASKDEYSNIAAAGSTDNKIAPADKPAVATLPSAQKQESSATLPLQPPTAGAASTSQPPSTVQTELASLPAEPPPTEFKHRIATATPPQINFWIELYRDGKFYRCNNKTEFKSGDSIRFHLIPGSDGYAYLVMKAGTTGKSDVLFPKAEYGTRNYLTKGQDYLIPSKEWMQFDTHPGTEQLGLVFTSEKVDNPQSLKDQTMTCFVSPEKSGSKDFCGTRMKLSWDDPTPVMLPDEFSAVTQVHNSGSSSLVRLRSTASEGMISASIQLLHK